MLRRLASATLLLLLACDDGPACVIDTDCEGFQICVDEACVPRGGIRDADVGDGPESDGGEGEDGGPADMGPEPGSLGTGVVSARSVPEGADPLTEPGSHLVIASFSAAGGDSTCTTTDIDGCSVVTCEPAPPPGDAGVPEDMGTPGDAGPPPALPNAGTIQLAGGTVAISLEPAEDTGLYAPVSGTMPLFMQGTELVANAPGDGVPSFATTGLEGVDELAVTAPAIPDTGLVLDSTMATDVTWTAPDTPTEDQTTQIRLTSTVGDGGSVTITCEVPVADGSKTLSTDLFDAMPGGASHGIRVITHDQEVLDREGWRITVEAWARGLSGSRIFDVPFTFGDRAAP